MNEQKILVVEDDMGRFAKAAAALESVNKALAKKNEDLDPTVESMARRTLESSKRKLERFLNVKPEDARSFMTDFHVGAQVNVYVDGMDEPQMADIERLKADGRMTLIGWMPPPAGAKLKINRMDFVVLWAKNEKAGLRLAR